MHRNRSILLWRPTAVLFVALLAAPSGAEVISVGPSGCGQPTLALAWLRAAVTPESDTIIITTNQTHTGGTGLVLANESSVTIQGGTSCSDHSFMRRTITTTIGNLFDFDNTSATFREMSLVGDTGGRLITATGVGTLIVLDDATVRDGVASDGGNVHLSGGASLVLLADSLVTRGNASFDGGGIFCTGGGTVALGEDSLVVRNDAGFNGAGIYASNCLVNVLSGGLRPGGADYFGVIENRAGFNGGGIYAINGATVTISGTSERPGSIRRNTAELNGGGLYLTGSGTTAQALASEIVDNEAFHNGGGVYLTSDADLELDRDLTTCARGFECSLLAGNNAGIGLVGVTAEGGAIAVFGGAQAEIRQTYITDNTATNDGSVAQVNGAGSLLLIEGSALYANEEVGTHISARAGGTARLGFISAWGSSAPGLGMTFAQAGDAGRVELFSSIIVEGNGAGPDAVFGPAGVGASHIADCVIAHETTSFPSDPFGTLQVQTNPALVWDNPAAGDPHLLATSAAIDYCDAAAYLPIDNDLDNEPRGTDEPTILDFFGPYDLGADEWNGTPPSSLPFTDGFESGDTSAWSSTVP